MRRDGKMAKTKKIETEETENDIKVNEIEAEVDTDTVNTEAENIDEMKLEIYKHTYSVSELIKIMNKKKKTYLEQETANRFKELMFNYYRGIEYAVLRNCCGKSYTIQDLKKRLDYDIIDRRCSRKNMRFDKKTVDAVIKFVENYNK
jgi:hypothetical protein